MDASEAIQGLLIDLDGVLYIGDTPVPGARTCLDQLRARGVGVRFLTNTTTKTASEVAAKLVHLGFDIPAGEIFSAVTATRDYLSSHASCGRMPSVHLLVRQSVLPEFSAFPHASVDTGEGVPEFVVLGDIGAAWSYPLLNAVFNELMKGAHLVAMHRNKYWQTADGLRLDIGAFVAGLEYVTGIPSTVIGKPSSQFFQLAVDSLGLSPARIVMVGDDIETDVGGAQAAGLRGVLVRTGKYREAVAAQSRVRPDGVLDSLAQLTRWL
jgi:HAD superfamily hydrolase (TIGR01458 family)